MKITDISAMEILDSRGNPTLSVSVTGQNSVLGVAGVPSGASTGINEAVELRDGNPQRYRGRGVLRAVEHVNTRIRDALIGQDLRDQQAVDRLLCELDASDNKSNLGANAILGVSMAVMHAAAQASGQPLYRHLGASEQYRMPKPMMNIINGGAHANNQLDVQEFMIIPSGAPNFRECLRYGAEVFQQLRQLLADRGFSTAVGDEGGFAPDFASHSEALDFIMLAIEQAGYRPGEDISIALDVASSEWYRDGHYHLTGQSPQSSEDIIQMLTQWVDQYPIVSIEDGLSEDDWSGWKQLTQGLGQRVQLVGDDLFVTNPKLLTTGIEQRVANALLVKPNQIGTVTETHQAVCCAQAAEYGVVLSHRSGETCDTSIADMAVGWGAGQIKAGSTCRSERVVKYNRLLTIEASLGERAAFC